MTSPDPDPPTTPIDQGDPTYAKGGPDELAQRSKLRVDRHEGRQSPSAAGDGAPARPYDLGDPPHPAGDPDDPAKDA